MREILFRGKRKDNGEWVEGHLVWYEDGRARITPRHTEVKYLVEDYNTIVHIAYEVIPETVGQFTGLTDKNGTKIFEGDILSSDWGYKGAVEFEDIIYANHECLFNEDCEVIGNIHDNPELLEV